LLLPAAPVTLAPPSSLRPPSAPPGAEFWAGWLQTAHAVPTALTSSPLQAAPPTQHMLRHSPVLVRRAESPRLQEAFARAPRQSVNRLCRTSGRALMASGLGCSPARTSAEVLLRDPSALPRSNSEPALLAFQLPSAQEGHRRQLDLVREQQPPVVSLQETISSGSLNAAALRNPWEPALSASHSPSAQEGHPREMQRNLLCVRQPTIPSPPGSPTVAAPAYASNEARVRGAPEQRLPPALPVSNRSPWPRRLLEHVIVPREERLGEDDESPTQPVRRLSTARMHGLAASDGSIDWMQQADADAATALVGSLGATHRDVMPTGSPGPIRSWPLNGVVATAATERIGCRDPEPDAEPDASARTAPTWGATQSEGLVSATSPRGPWWFVTGALDGSLSEAGSLDTAVPAEEVREAVSAF